MQRRTLGWIAVVLIDLSLVAAIRSQSTRFSSPRLEAWKLAQDAIEEGGIRKGVPKFITWTTAREIFPCAGHNPSSPRVSARSLLDESFHYNPQAAARLCEPLTPGGGAVSLDVAQPEWMKSDPKVAAITPAFPDGARLAGAFWNAVRRPVNSQNGKIVQMAIRSAGAVGARRIRITLPERITAETSSCAPPADQGEPAAADAVDVSLDQFFWVRLNPGERYNGASCGDFAVLMAFHLVHKVQGRWLWTTFWWDPESKEFGRDRPNDFKGAGENPRAWQNYAMDASFESTGTIFNPWRVEERGDNCARCHAEVTVYKSPTSDARISFDSVMAARSRFQ